MIKTKDNADDDYKAEFAISFSLKVSLKHWFQWENVPMWQSPAPAFSLMWVCSWFLHTSNFVTFIYSSFIYFYVYNGKLTRWVMED